MKFIKQTLIAIFAVVALSVAAHAQKDGKKDPPPKEKPPVVRPGDKPKDPPKDDKKPKKPSMALYASVRAEEMLS